MNGNSATFRQIILGIPNPVNQNSYTETSGGKTKEKMCWEVQRAADPHPPFPADLPTLPMRTPIDAMQIIPWLPTNIFGE